MQVREVGPRARQKKALTRTKAVEGNIYSSMQVLAPNRAPYLRPRGITTGQPVRNLIFRNPTIGPPPVPRTAVKPMAILGFNFNLREQLVFYGSYHSNPINQAIHFIFVPCILWTVAVWFAYTPPLCHCDMSTHLGFLPASIAALAK